MDYKQLFTQAMQRPDITEALAKAKELAGNITSYQKKQRTAPIMQALQQFANNYHAATTDEARQAANAMANKARANYLAGGGSGTDLPQQYWGSDPAAGFQTTEGYASPITGYEGLPRLDIIGIKRSIADDALRQRVEGAGITGIDPMTGNKTWLRQYQEQALANQLLGYSGGGGGQGGGGGSSGAVGGGVVGAYPSYVTTAGQKNAFDTARAGQLLQSWYQDKLQVPEFAGSPFIAAVEAMRSFAQDPDVQNALTAAGVDMYDVMDEFTRTHTEFPSLNALKGYVEQRNTDAAKGWFGTKLFAPKNTYENDPLWKLLNATIGDVL